MNKFAVKTNKVKCLSCSEVLESISRHDFKECSCDNHAFCDGGHDYQRIGAMDLKQVQIWKEGDDW